MADYFTNGRWQSEQRIQNQGYQKGQKFNLTILAALNFAVGMDRVLNEGSIFYVSLLDI